MADTTMEVDAAPQLGFEEHLEDDLITYDENTAPDALEPEKIVAEGPDHGVATNERTEESGPVYHEEQEIESKMSHTATEDAGEGHTITNNESVEEEAQPEVDFFETADESLDTGLGESAPVEEEQGESHEIDYDDDIAADHDSGHHEVGNVTVPDQEIEVQTHDAKLSERGDAGDDMGVGLESHDEHHEISWEHEEGNQNERTAHSSNETAIPQPTADGNVGQSGQEEHHQVEVDDAEEPQAASAADVAGGDDAGVVEKSYATGTDVPEHGYDDASQDDDENAPQTDFPAITVHYKGDDFPLFSLSSEGFFSQASVLDDSIKTLLAGFRAELNDELLPQDDLVLQVDELGLEFAESSSVDTLSNITLRQVLEVFDILVKNQDPESTRTLYTYLFTRPSTNKRFEYLMESATGGKGLDEVIHLFDSPLGHGRGIAETSAGDDDFDTQLNDVESADDNEGDSAENEDHSGSPGDTDDSDVLDTYDAGMDHDEGFQHFDEAAASAARQDGGDDEQGEQQEELQQTFLTTDSNGNYSRRRGLFRNQELTLYCEDYQESDADAFLTGDFDESEDVVENDLEDIDAGDFTNLGTNATSTTTTIEDDGDVTPALADIGIVETEHNDLTIEDVVEPEDLDEIDWRDDPEAPDDDAGESSSTTTKRARGDDTGAEDEQGKRHKPDRRH